jgi:putative transposase
VKKFLVGRPVSPRDPGYTEEQVDAAVRLLKSGTPVADVCRQTGIAEATLHLWKKTIVTLGFPEVREGRELREENARLRRLLTGPELDKRSSGR